MRIDVATILIASIALLACASKQTTRQCIAPPEFEMIDKNQNCEIARDEWSSMVRRSVSSLPASKARKQFETTQIGLFSQLDKNGSESIDTVEWRKADLSTIQDIPD
jgi:hypothetical protein